MKSDWVDIRERVPEDQQKCLIMYKYVSERIHVVNCFFMKESNAFRCSGGGNMDLRNVLMWIPEEKWMPEGVE